MLKRYKYTATIGKMFDNNPPRPFENFYKNMVALTRKFHCGAGEELKETDATVSWHTAGRNEIANKAEGAWTYFCDTDQIGKPDVILRLLHQMEKHKAAVVSGLYLNKHPGSGHVPVANLWNEDKTGFRQLTEWPKGTEIMPIATVGGGCLLVKNSVFAKIRRELKCEPFDLIGGLSEDYSFCARAWELKIPVYLCPQIQVHHYVPHILDAKDFGFEKG